MLKNDFTNIKFPTEIDDIKKFCKRNNISINLYIIDNKNIKPYLTYSRDEKKLDHINLLLLEDNEKSH